MVEGRHPVTVGNNNQICAIVGKEGQSFEERVPDDYGLWGLGT